jgi:hypothetical protein
MRGRGRGRERRGDWRDRTEEEPRHYNEEAQLRENPFKKEEEEIYTKGPLHRRKDYQEDQKYKDRRGEYNRDKKQHSMQEERFDKLPSDEESKTGEGKPREEKGGDDHEKKWDKKIDKKFGKRFEDRDCAEHQRREPKEEEPEGMTYEEFKAQ